MTDDIIIHHTAHILKSFDIEPKPLDRIVDAYFRRHREINSPNRKIISDAAFEIMRWKRRIDYFLKISGVKKIDNQSRIKYYFEQSVGAYCNTPLQSEFCSYPDFLFQKFIKDYGKDDALKLMLSLNEKANPVLRVNTERINRDEVLKSFGEMKILAMPTKYSPFGIILSERVNLDEFELYKKGLVEIQDEASQLAAILSDPQPNEVVLDACAGAGGKTLAMAMLMQNKGKIIAADPDDFKLKELSRRAKRAGVSIVKTVKVGANDYSPLQKCGMKGKFDLVFIDAPCSGTGTLRRSPDLKWRLSEETINERVKIQRKLLSEYAEWARVGGRVVYATCSVLKEENEDVVSGLAKTARFISIDVREIFGKHKISCSNLVTNEGYLKTNPTLGNFDGFFAAVFKKMK